jgi:arylsulfatase A-like enzyme
MARSVGFGRGFDSYVELAGRRAEVQFLAASQELSRVVDDREPFFLFVHTYEVHGPYLPPREYREQFVDPEYAGRIIGDKEELMRVSGATYAQQNTAYWDRVDPGSPADRKHLMDLYDAGIRYTDDSLGILLDRLEQSGAADRTIVVVLSDHGEEFGEHGRFKHEALWRELLQVPLVMRVPEKVRPGWRGRRIPEVVGLVDMVPTLLDLLRIPIPEHMQGRSLVRQVEGGEEDAGWVFAQLPASGGAALFTGEWKWLHEGGESEAMLFDLSTDPSEFMDQSEEQREWRRQGSLKVRRIRNASRAFWPLAGEAAPTEMTPDLQQQLEALGYIESPAEDPSEAAPE